jgi:hypothetical protein
MRTHRGAPEPTRPALSSPSSTGYAATHGRYSSAMMSTASHSLRIHVLIDLIHSHQTVTMPATSASNCIHVIMTAINMRALLMRDKRGLDAKSLLDGIAATVDRVERKSGCCFPSASHTHDGNVQDLLLEVHLQIGLDVVRTSPIAGSMQLDELHRTSHLRESRTDACRRSVYLSARLGKKDVYSQILPHLRLDPPIYTAASCTRSMRPTPFHDPDFPETINQHRRYRAKIDNRSRASACVCGDVSRES